MSVLGAAVGATESGGSSFLSPASANPTTRYLSPLAQVNELASEVRLSGGKPTAFGQAILDADESGDATKAAAAVSFPEGSTVKDSLRLRYLTTGTTRVPAATRALASSKRIKSWSGYYYFWCGQCGIANISFYCPAAAACSSRAYFSDGDVMTKSNGYCPAGGGGCVATTSAQPAYPDVVDWMQVYRSTAGPPSVISTWCS